MSTTFDIYPSNDRIPTFDEVLKRTTSEYHDFLAEINIQCKPKILAKILNLESNIAKEYKLNDPFYWTDESYLWVQVEGISGGTDGYMWEIEPDDREGWEEDILSMERCKPIRAKIETCIAQKYRWNFRRSAGQPGAINILYGVLSGSLAAITEGIVYSDDSAWDYEKMPIQGKEFLNAYYRPHLESNATIKHEALSSIEWAIKEFEQFGNK